MNASDARGIAMAMHVGQFTPYGEPVVEHVARVAAAVAPEARAAAWLHDLLERPEARAEELRALGLTRDELDALELLTRSPIEPYKLYAARIANAPGEAGRIARAVKLAELDDHLSRPARPGDPPYAWARRRIARVAI